MSSCYCRPRRQARTRQSLSFPLFSFFIEWVTHYVLIVIDKLRPWGGIFLSIVSKPTNSLTPIRYEVWRLFRWDLLLPDI